MDAVERLVTLTEPEPANPRRAGRLLVPPKQGWAVDAAKAVEANRKDRRQSFGRID